jgi:hypothetical protein
LSTGFQDTASEKAVDANAKNRKNKLKVAKTPPFVLKAVFKSFLN